MRGNDTFRLFSSAPVPAITKTSPEAKNTEESDTDMVQDYDGQEKQKGEDLIVLTKTKDFAQQRLIFL